MFLGLRTNDPQNGFQRNHIHIIHIRTHTNPQQHDICQSLVPVQGLPPRIGPPQPIPRHHNHGLRQPPNAPPSRAVMRKLMRHALGRTNPMLFFLIIHGLSSVGFYVSAGAPSIVPGQVQGCKLRMQHSPRVRWTFCSLGWDSSKISSSRAG